MFSCLESANLQKKLTKIGLFHRWVRVELNPLNDDSITELLPNQLLQLKEITLCWDLDPNVKQCGCSAVDDWHWIWFHASEFLLFCSFSYSRDLLTCNHLQQSPDDVTRWWRTVFDYEDQIAKKKRKTDNKESSRKWWRTLVVLAEKERCAEQQQAICAGGCLFHCGEKQETNWSCRQLGAPPSRRSPFHHPEAALHCSSSRKPQVEVQQQQQEQPVWPFPITFSKLSQFLQVGIPYPPLFLLLLFLLLNFVLQLLLSPLQAFWRISLSEEIYKTQIPKCNSHNSTHNTLCNQNFCNKQVDNVSETKIEKSFLCNKQNVCVCVRVCACPLQQNRIKFFFSATTPKIKLKNHTIMVVGVFFLFTSRSFSNLRTHQSLDDDQRPKFLAMIAESAPPGLALGFEDQGGNLSRSSWILCERRHLWWWDLSTRIRGAGDCWVFIRGSIDFWSIKQFLWREIG